MGDEIDGVDSENSVKRRKTFISPVTTSDIAALFRRNGETPNKVNFSSALQAAPSQKRILETSQKYGDGRDRSGMDSVDSGMILEVEAMSTFSLSPPRTPLKQCIRPRSSSTHVEDFRRLDTCVELCLDNDDFLKCPSHSEFARIGQESTSLSSAAQFTANTNSHVAAVVEYAENSEHCDGTSRNLRDMNERIILNTAMVEKNKERNEVSLDRVICNGFENRPNGADFTIQKMTDPRKSGCTEKHTLLMSETVDFERSDNVLLDENNRANDICDGNLLKSTIKIEFTELEDDLTNNRANVTAKNAVAAIDSLPGYETGVCFHGTTIKHELDDQVATLPEGEATHENVTSYSGDILGYSIGKVKFECMDSTDKLLENWGQEPVCMEEGINHTFGLDTRLKSESRCNQSCQVTGNSLVDLGAAGKQWQRERKKLGISDAEFAKYLLSVYVGSFDFLATQDTISNEMRRAVVRCRRRSSQDSKLVAPSGSAKPTAPPNAPCSRKLATNIADNASSTPDIPTAENESPFFVTCATPRLRYSGDSLSEKRASNDGQNTAVSAESRIRVEPIQVQNTTEISSITWKKEGIHLKNLRVSIEPLKLESNSNVQDPYSDLNENQRARRTARKIQPISYEEPDLEPFIIDKVTVDGFMTDDVLREQCSSLEKFESVDFVEEGVDETPFWFPEVEIPVTAVDLIDESGPIRRRCQSYQKRSKVGRFGDIRLRQSVLGNDAKLEDSSHKNRNKTTKTKGGYTLVFCEKSYVYDRMMKWIRELDYYIRKHEFRQFHEIYGHRNLKMLPSEYSLTDEQRLKPVVPQLMMGKTHSSSEVKAKEMKAKSRRSKSRAKIGLYTCCRRPKPFVRSRYEGVAIERGSGTTRRDLKDSSSRFSGLTDGWEVLTTEPSVSNQQFESVDAEHLEKQDSDNFRRSFYHPNLNKMSTKTDSEIESQSFDDKLMTSKSANKDTMNIIGEKDHLTSKNRVEPVSSVRRKRGRPPRGRPPISIRPEKQTTKVRSELRNARRRFCRLIATAQQEMAKNNLNNVLDRESKTEVTEKSSVRTRYDFFADRTLNGDVLPTNLVGHGEKCALLHCESNRTDLEQWFEERLKPHQNVATGNPCMVEFREEVSLVNLSEIRRRYVCQCEPPFHTVTFPKDEHLRSSWMKIIKSVCLRKWQPTDDDFICSRHFCSLESKLLQPNVNLLPCNGARRKMIGSISLRSQFTSPDLLNPQRSLISDSGHSRNMDTTQSNIFCAMEKGESKNKRITKSSKIVSGRKNVPEQKNHKCRPTVCDLRKIDVVHQKHSADSKSEEGYSTTSCFKEDPQFRERLYNGQKYVVMPLNSTTQPSDSGTF